jgi:hypothetical protein
MCHQVFKAPKNSKPIKMNMNDRIGVWRSLLVACSCLWSLTAAGQGQTGTAQLNITMTVQSSISLVFQDNPAVGTNGFCPLTNSGTNNVGLDLGSASFTGGDSLTCVAFIKNVGAGFYQVSSAFDVVVTKANSSSPNYRLAAQISAAPPANVTWLINNIALTNSAFTQLDATDNYATPITKTLQVQVKNPVPAQVLQETITFLASAN